MTTDMSKRDIPTSENEQAETIVRGMSVSFAWKELLPQLNP